jgi:hypothetical protein
LSQSVVPSTIARPTTISPTNRKPVFDTFIMKMTKSEGF